MSEIRHFHLFCGLGGGALGFNRGRAAIDGRAVTFRCIGGVDSDPAAVADFEALTGVPATCLDLFNAEDYQGFHGEHPPAAWRPASAEDIQSAAGGERPHVVFSSPPCKGFSGLIPQKTATSLRYQALNRLTIRGVMLALDAWGDDPPEFFLLENVPRVQTRGRDFIDQIRALLEGAGYAVAETVHDCGEVGGLAQTRQRFLMVARHQEKVPPFLYEPPKRSLRSVGEVIGPMPLPGDPAAGPMHAMRRLEWKTWVRLALIPAGGDWRDLRDLAVENSHLRDFTIEPAAAYYSGAYGVRPCDQHSGTVTGKATPSNGAFAIADPRYHGSGEYGQWGVRRWQEPASTVTAQSAPGGGPYSIADPRWPGRQLYSNAYRVTRFDEASQTVLTSRSPGSGGGSVADPRPPRTSPSFNNVFRVISFDGSAGAVTAGGSPSSGGQAVADPRLGWGNRSSFRTQRHYGVVPWSATSGAVTAAARHDNGPWNLADPRLTYAPLVEPSEMPEPRQRMVAVIRALDGCWHRPFTTLELAALQGFVGPEDHLELEGDADTHWRQRIGNAVPPPAAAAMASVIGHALLLAWSGETFALGATPIWARRLGVALSVDTGDS